MEYLNIYTSITTEPTQSADEDCVIWWKAPEQASNNLKFRLLLLIDILSSFSIHSLENLLSIQHIAKEINDNDNKWQHDFINIAHS